MITTAQIRAGRGLLKWTQATLAHHAAISAATLNMIENETVRPRPGTLAAIRRALEQAGVQLLDEAGMGVGVRFTTSPSAADPGRRSALAADQQQVCRPGDPVQPVSTFRA